MIPKRIHYVWVGSALPERQRTHVDSWRRTNPDFECVLWNESNIDFSHPRLRQAYEQRRWAKVADMVRLKAVGEQGGFYLDTDFVLYRSLTPLLAHSCVLGFQSEARCADWVANGMMAAEPGHWLIEAALKRALAMRPLPFGLDRPTAYGPKLITRLLIEHGLDAYDPDGVFVKDVLVCPTRSFFPWAYGQPFDEAVVAPDSYGMHLWEKSWAVTIPPWIRLLKAVRDRSRSALRLGMKPRGPAARHRSG